MKNLRRILFYTFTLLNCVLLKSFAQSPELRWATSAGGNRQDVGRSIATDKNGNVYVTGAFFSPGITFGNTTLKNTSDSTGDIFIVKYKSDGNVIWAQSVGGDAGDGSYGIDIDNSGNVVITGYYSSASITFGKNTLYNTTGSNDIFIAKYDPDGNVIWAKSAGGSSYDLSNSISTDNFGNTYITGIFYSPFFIFGKDTLVSTGGSADIFTAKYDSDGNVAWARSAGGNATDQGNSIATDGRGNAYVTGSFASPFSVFGTDTLVNLCGFEMFVVKYDSNGNVLWARSAKGEGFDHGSSISADDVGNIFVTGSSNSVFIRFGTITLENKENSNNNIIIAKYDPDGNILWAQSTVGSNSDIGTGIVTDGSNNVYLTGSFKSFEILFGTRTLKNTKDSTADIFVTKFDPTGKVLWVQSFGGNSEEAAHSIATDMDGNIYLTGSFKSNPLTFGTSMLDNSGNNDVFIASLNDPTTAITEKIQISYIKVFPNPTASQFHIAIPEPGNWTITIYTLDGQSVFKKDITEANATIDLSGKAKGAYVYRLLKDGEVFKSGKLMLE